MKKNIWYILIFTVFFLQLIFSIYENSFRKHESKPREWQGIKIKTVEKNGKYEIFVSTNEGINWIVLK